MQVRPQSAALLASLTALLCALAAVPPAAAAGAGWVELQRLDSALAGGGLTLEAVVEGTEDPCADGTEIGYRVEEVVIVADGEVRALRSTRAYPDLPDYRAPGGGPREVDWDGAGNYLVWRESDALAVAGPGLDESLTRFQLLRVRPDGSVLPEPSFHPQLARRPPTLAGGAAKADLVLLALGRGASRLFREAGEWSPERGGVRAVARGVLAGPGQGTWSAAFDPKGGYLLRQATFATGLDAPLLTVTTEGTVQVGATTLARQGELRLGRPGESGYQISVRLTDARPGADRALLADLRRQLAAPLPEGGERLDYRTSPITRSFEGDDEADPIPIPVRRPCCLCAPVNESFDECGHLAASVRCASEWCIKNVVTTASCIKLRDAGDSLCDIVSPVPPQPEATQTVRLLANGGCPTGGNLVVYSTKFRTYDGCNACTLLGERLHQTACQIESCPAGLDACTRPRGIRRACP
jgi:hypothetical protein